MIPSPNPKVLRIDPKRWGARFVDAKWDSHREAVRDHAAAAGHPSVYDREDTATPLVMLPMVTTLEASLIVTALRGSAFLPCHELGERLAHDLRARPVPVDVCPPFGTPRPGGVAWCVTHQGIADECGGSPEGHCDMSDKCQPCHGSGWGDDDLTIPCESCNGDGYEACDIRTLYVAGDKS